MSDIKMKKPIIYISLPFFAFLILYNLITYFENNVTLYIALCVLVLPAIFILTARINIEDKHFILILFTIAFIAKATTAVLFETPPVSDFKIFYDSAIMAAKGDFSFSNTTYFQNWGYQSAIVLFYAALIKIFGPGLLSLKLVNCFFMAGTNILIYLILSNIVKKDNARFISILYLIYPAPYFLTSVITNQHVSNFFLFAGIYVYLTRHKKSVYSIIPAAFLLALGNAFRPQGIVVIASIAVIEFLGYKKARRKELLATIMLIFLYFLIGQVFSNAVRTTGVNENGLKNNFPEYKFVVGLNHDTTGAYSAQDENDLMSITDKRQRRDRALELIKIRISDPKKSMKLIIDKQKAMWCDFDTTIDWGFDYLEGKRTDVFGRTFFYSQIRRIAQRLEKTIYIFVFVLAFFGIYSMLDKKRYDKTTMFFIFLTMAIFATYVLIEIQFRYRDFSLISIFIIAAKGLDYLNCNDLRKLNNL